MVPCQSSWTVSEQGKMFCPQPWRPICTVFIDCATNTEESVGVSHNVLDSMSLNNSRSEPVSQGFRGRLSSILELDLSNRLPTKAIHLTSSNFRFAKFILSYDSAPFVQSFVLRQNCQRTVIEYQRWSCSQNCCCYWKTSYKSPRTSSATTTWTQHIFPLSSYKAQNMFCRNAFQWYHGSHVSVWRTCCKHHTKSRTRRHESQAGDVQCTGVHVPFKGLKRGALCYDNNGMVVLNQTCCMVSLPPVWLTLLVLFIKCIFAPPSSVSHSTMLALICTMFSTWCMWNNCIVSNEWSCNVVVFLFMQIPAAANL